MPIAVEHLVRGAQLLARVGAPALAAQPLAVEQVRAGQLRHGSGCGRAARSPRGTAARRGSPSLSSARERASIPSAQSVPAALVASDQPPQGVGGAPGLPGPGGRLDQLDQRPSGETQLAWVFAAPFGRGQRLVVAAEAVVEHRGRPLRAAVSHVLRRAPHPGVTAVDQRGGLGFRAPATRRATGRRRARRATRRPCDRLRLLGQRSGRARSPATSQIASRVQRGRAGQLSERPPRGQLDRRADSTYQLLVVPDVTATCGTRATASADVLVGGASWLREDACSACFSTGAPAACPSVISDGQAVQQQIGRRAAAPAARGADSAARGHLAADPPPVRQAAGEHRRVERVQVGLAREPGIERLEPLGRLDQQQRGASLPAAGGERHLSAQQVDAGLLELIQRPGRRHGEQLGRRVERAGLETRLRGRQGPPRPGGPGRPSARPRAARTPPPRPGRRGPGPGPLTAPAPRPPPHRVPAPPRQVPGPPVRITVAVGHLGQRPVHRPPLLRRRRRVDRRPDQRMPEPHRPPISQQPVGLGRRRSRGRDRRAARPPARPAPDPRPARPPRPAAATACRPGSASSRRRKRCSIRAGSRRAGQPEPARQLRRASARAAAPAAPAGCLASRPRSGPGPAHRAGTGPPSPAARGRPRPAGPDLQVRQPPELLARLARGEDQPDRLGQQPPRHERQHLRRRPVQPLRVIDHAQQRPVLRHLRQQGSARPARPGTGPARAPVAQPERDAQRVALRTRQVAPAGPAAARTADAGRRTPAPSPIPPPPPGPPACPPPPRPGTPAAPTCPPPPHPAPPAPARARSQIPQQAIERRALCLAVQQRRRRLRSRPHAHLRPQVQAPARRRG